MGITVGWFYTWLYFQDHESYSEKASWAFAEKLRSNLELLTATTESLKETELLGYYYNAKYFHNIARKIRKMIRNIYSAAEQDGYKGDYIGWDRPPQPDDLFDIAYILEERALKMYNKIIKKYPNRSYIFYLNKGAILYSLTNHPTSDALACNFSDDGLCNSYYKKMIKAFNTALSLSPNKKSTLHKVLKICHDWPPKEDVVIDNDPVGCGSEEKEIKIENIPF